MPGPSSSHRRRSRTEPSARRGYHANGTDTTRPSRSSTMSARSVTRTFSAAAISVATLEVVMPRLCELSFVFSNNASDAVEFRPAESIVVRHSNGREPELRELDVPLDVNVDRLVSVAREEEKPVRPAPQDSWTHRIGFCQFSKFAANRLFSSSPPVQPAPSRCSALLVWSRSRRNSASQSRHNSRKRLY